MNSIDSCIIVLLAKMKIVAVCLVVAAVLGCVYSANLAHEPVFVYVRETGELVQGNGGFSKGANVTRIDTGIYCIQMMEGYGSLGTYNAMQATIQSQGNGNPSDDIGSVVVNTGFGNSCNSLGGSAVFTFDAEGKLANKPFSLLIGPRA